MYDETGGVEEGWYSGLMVCLESQRRHGLDACSYITTAWQCKS